MKFITHEDEEYVLVTDVAKEVHDWADDYDGHAYPVEVGTALRDLSHWLRKRILKSWTAPDRSSLGIRNAP